MKCRLLASAVLLVVVLVAVSSEGRLQPTEQQALDLEGPGVDTDVDPQKLASKSSQENPFVDGGASSRRTSTTSSSAGSKQAAAVTLAGEVLQQLALHYEVLQMQLQQQPEADLITVTSSAAASRTLLGDGSNSTSAGNTRTAQQSSNSTATTTTTTTTHAVSNKGEGSGKVCMMWAPLASSAEVALTQAPPRAAQT
ncbi:hypothetical protein COO60DRAFT_509284 [Scenedesmus sp. NREL 46B-D3]|nr:hypothetical protein COO60DRAFT_509284 [Scenedesmus sp. NREL 46B-D3]